MDVFFMIFGFFIVFLVLFICVATIFFGSKKNTVYKKETSVDVSGFEKILKEKENSQQSTTIESRIEKINRAEKELNLNIGKNQHRQSMIADPVTRLNAVSRSEDEIPLEIEDGNPEKNISTVSNGISTETRLRDSTKRKGKIKGHRHSRSLVTVDKGKDDLLFQTIEKMEMEGMTLNEIAKKLGRGVREVEIIKRLNEKS